MRDWECGYNVRDATKATAPLNRLQGLILTLQTPENASYLCVWTEKLNYSDVYMSRPIFITLASRAAQHVHITLAREFVQSTCSVGFHCISLLEKNASRTVKRRESLVHICPSNKPWAQFPARQRCFCFFNNSSLNNIVHTHVNSALNWEHIM